jgi:hypothetical protein
MKKIFKELFELFVKSNKREPNAIEMLQLKFKASQKASQQVGKGEVIPFPPERITDWTKARPQPPEIEIIDGVQTTRGLGDLFERQMKNIGKKDPALYEDRGGNIIPAQFKDLTKDSLPPGGTRESVRKEAIEKYGIQPERVDEIMNTKFDEKLADEVLKDLDLDDALPNYTETPGEYSRRNTPGSIENLREEMKIAYRNEFDRLTGNETAEELKEILKNLDTDGVPFAEGGPAEESKFKSTLKSMLSNTEGGVRWNPEKQEYEMGGGYYDDDKMFQIVIGKDGRKEVLFKKKFNQGGPTSTGLNYLLGEDDTNSRVPYGAGGRRGFLKLLAGLGAAGAAFKTGLMSLTKGGVKPIVKELISVPIGNPQGMPVWFKPLVNKIIKEGDDVTKKFGTVDRELVHTKKLDKFEEVTVYQDLSTGNVRLEYGPHLTDDTGKVIRASNEPNVVHLEYKAPEVIEPNPTTGKGGGKTKDEFYAAESEPEIVNWDGDIEMSGINEVNTVDDLIADTSKLQKYATDNKLTIKELSDSMKKQKYKNKLDSDPMEQVNYIENKQGMDAMDYIDEGARVGDFDSKGYRNYDTKGMNLYDGIKKIEKAEGGRIGYAGGKKVVQGLISLLNKKAGKNVLTTADKLPIPKKTIDRDMFRQANNRLNKKRQLTDQEIQDYEMELGDSETWMSEGTVGEAENALKNQKAYQAEMYQQYKMGKLDPVAGDKSPARKRFLEQKLEDMEGSGDKRLMTRDEIEELSTFDLGTQMDQMKEVEINKIKKGLSKKDKLKKELSDIEDKIEDMIESGVDEMDPRLDKLNTRQNELGIQLDFENKMDNTLAEKKGKKLADSMSDAEIDLRDEFPGIEDRLIKQILTDDNPQRVAEVKQTMREALEMQNKGMSVDEIIQTFKGTTRTKQAEGGRMDLWLGGGLKAGKSLTREMLKFMSKGSTNAKSPKELLKLYNPKQFNRLLDNPLNTGKISPATGETADEMILDMINRTKEDRADMVGDLIGSARRIKKVDDEILAYKNKIIKEMVDGGIDEKTASSFADLMAKEMKEGAAPLLTSSPPKITEQGLIELENIQKNLKTKGRKLNATGGLAHLLGE